MVKVKELVKQRAVGSDGRFSASFLDEHHLSLSSDSPA